MRVRTLLRLSFACLALLMLAPSVASGAAPSLYVIPTIFLHAEGGEAAAAAAHALPNRASGDYFLGRFKAAFPTTVAQITDATSRRTFVVSLQIPRVSAYEIPKANGAVERQFAMTGSLYFTNVATGEVLFTYTTTAYLAKAALQSAGPASEPELSRLYTTLFDGLVDDLVSKAAATFKPLEISATARRVFGNLIIFDKGTSAGVLVGDSFTAVDGAGAKVVFSDLNYALAEPEFGGRAQPGVQWSKYSTGTVSDVRKAKALVKLAVNGSSFPDETIQQMFADALGEKSALSLVPVNRDYSEVVNAVRTGTDLSREKTASRRLPQYFVRLSVAQPISYETPTNIAYKTLRVARARVYAELVDQSGRVQFAGFGEDTIKDEVTAGMSYAPEARAEVVVKNAVVDLVRKMGAQLRLEQTDLPITSAQGGTFEVADMNAVLRLSANLTVLRSIGAVDAIAGPVRIATWTTHVTDLAGAEAKAVGDLPVFLGAPDIKTGDIARLDRVALVQSSGRKLRPCGSSQALGGRKLADYEALAINQFASWPQAETYFGGFVRDLTEELHESGEFESSPTPPSAAQEFCIEPANRIDFVKENCDQRDLCSSDIALLMGYRIRRGQEVVQRSALQTTVHSSAYPRSVAPADRDALIDADLTSASASLLKGALEQPDFQKAIH